VNEFALAFVFFLGAAVRVLQKHQIPPEFELAENERLNAFSASFWSGASSRGAIDERRVCEGVAVSLIRGAPRRSGCAGRNDEWIIAKAFVGERVGDDETSDCMMQWSKCDVA